VTTAAVTVILYYSRLSPYFIVLGVALVYFGLNFVIG
jgi:hypothetical protein